MIPLHDRVIVITGGGKDEFGNPIPEVDNGPFPADVRPLRSSESIAAGQPPLTSYYRLVIADGGELLAPDKAIRWNGKRHAVEGDVEPHHVNGRLHHWEATVKVG